jgi:PKD repeat protein
MVLSLNANNRVRSSPTGVTGWTVLDTATSTGMATTVYTKVADAGDGGKRVTVPLDLAAKYTLTVAAYSGVRTGNIVAAKFVETATQAGHTTPVITAPPGAWVISEWADKSSATTGFTLPAGVISRGAACAASTGRVCSVLADSNGSVPAGNYGGLTATADSASNNASTWSIILRTTEPNVPPTAAFTQECSSLSCNFDGSDSSDSDGTVASYAWDFGGGVTATGVSPNHDFPATGSYVVTLTVTDDQGAVSTTTPATVSVTRTNAPPVAQFTQTCRFLVCDFEASGSSDSDGTIDTYAWDYGDGTDTGVAPPDHTFSAGGSYQVSLTVTDNDGTATTLVKTVTVVAIKPIAFVASSVNQGNVVTPNATVPATASVGDRLLMVLSLNASTRVQSNPTGVTGWDLLATQASGGMATTVYSKLAQSGDAGKKVTVPIDAASKYTMTIAAYTGDMVAPTFASAGETVFRPDHTTPTITTTTDGAWVLSYWADKSSATTAFTLPTSVTSRGATCGTSTGRVCSVLADSGATVPAGPYGGLAAISDSPQAMATMWTIVMNPVV